MKKVKKLVVGNWKMNPSSLEDAKALASGIKRGMKSIRRSQVVLCPPFVYISPLSKIPGGSLFLGAQNAYPEPTGPHTGEVSFYQLPQLKVSFVIVGHSERRKMGETDEMVNKKIKAIVPEGMTAIVCVGESTRDHNGEYFEIVKHQIQAALKDVNKKFLDRVIIAYEPIWAIGGNHGMQPRDVHEMSIYVRKVLKDMYGMLSDSIRIIYGGGVSPGDAEELTRNGGVSGFLVGHESLRLKDFLEIIKEVDQA